MYFCHHYPVTELTNIENNEHQKDSKLRREDTKLRRDRIQNPEILKIMEDQTTDYIHKKQRLAHIESSKIMDNINSPIQTYCIDFK